MKPPPLWCWRRDPPRWQAQRARQHPVIGDIQNGLTSCRRGRRRIKRPGALDAVRLSACSVPTSPGSNIVSPSRDKKNPVTLMAAHAHDSPDFPKSNDCVDSTATLAKRSLCSKFTTVAAVCQRCLISACTLTQQLSGQAHENEVRCSHESRARTKNVLAWRSR